MIYLVGASLEGFQSSTVEECVEYFKDKKYIQVDTETESNKRNPDYLPNPFEHRILCIQIGDRDNQWVIDRDVDFSALKPLMEDPSKVKIFVNAMFDLRFILHWKWKIRNVYDCFLVERLLTLGLSMPKGYLGLGGMAERYCGVSLKKEVRGQIHWRGLDATVATYAAEDVKYLEEILHKQMEKVKEDGLEKVVRLENLHVISLARISYNGFGYDAEKANAYCLQNEHLLKEYSDKLEQFILDMPDNGDFIEKQLDLFSDKVHCTINWDSSQQVVKLFKRLGIDCQVRDTNTGMYKDSVDGKHLQRQIKKHPILPIYLRYKEIGKEISTYGYSFTSKNVNPVTGRIHSEFFPILDTGRISSNHPNLQNIPALAEDGSPNPLRKCFVAPPGRKLIICDYSGQEDRILADKCKDPLLTEVFLEGSGDTHSLTATAISPFFFGEEIIVSKKNNPMIESRGKRIRDIAKILNFKMAYGGTAFTLKDDLECSQEEAQAIIDLIVNKFVGKTNYFKKCHAQIHAQGYMVIDEVTGRRSYFNQYKEFQELKAIPHDWRSKDQKSAFYKIKGSMERMSQNYPIQGTAASMTKTAVIMFDAAVEEYGLDAFIVNAVHDEVVVEASDEDAEIAAKILQKSMESAGRIFCKLIPIIAEPAIGDDWGAK